MSKIRLIKTLLTTTVICSLVQLQAQSQASSLLDSAKKMFNSTRQMPGPELYAYDFKKIVQIVKQSIALDDSNPEAYYYLGYALSRQNSKDGDKMNAMQIDLCLQASEALEKCIALNKNYDGEIIVLDPYSKLTSEWGSMALSFLNRQKKDSAIWALRIGKSRGAFNPYYMQLAKKSLVACSPNSTLVSAGDNLYFSLLYCQLIDSLRIDVVCIESGLLHSHWYPRYLHQQSQLKFNLPMEVIDTIDFINWTDTEISIGTRQWTLGPSYMNQYLLRGDRILLSILAADEFKRDVYFTFGFPDNEKLGLKEYCTSNLIVDKVAFADSTHPDPFEETLNESMNMLELVRFMNLNSRSEKYHFDYVRLRVLNEIEKLLKENQNTNAIKLFNILDHYASEKQYPLNDDSKKIYWMEISARIKVLKDLEKK